jgi:hypothetical protein
MFGSAYNPRSFVPDDDEQTRQWVRVNHELDDGPSTHDRPVHVPATQLPGMY